MSRRSTLNGTATRDIGPYRLAHRIAVGGMAEVYRALSPQAAGGDRAVVIKRLLPTLVDDPEQRAMFDHEAHLGLRIDHRNVVAVLDHGFDGEAPYLVLEYVFGVDLWRLTQWLKRTGRSLRTPLSVWIGCELLRGLNAVHAVRDDAGAALHIVHRDVSPSNVFLSVHGDVKLGDLGIARAALRDSQRRPGQGFRAKGKLGYLPPEQVAGHSVDQRGDVFSAAVVLAELLMGRPLFTGGTEIGVLLAIRDGDLSPLQTILPQLPSGLGEVVLSALDRRPAHRTASARRFCEQLLPFIDEPEDDLRRELGTLVVGVVDDSEGESDRSSLARTVEADASWYETVTPAPPSEPPARAPTQYEVERDGEPIGAFSLADLVRALTTGEVTATDVVRSPSISARPVARVEELARYLPASTRTPTARRRTRMAETSERYDLGGRSMLSVLVAAVVDREDGLLLCERNDVRKEVYLDSGVPVFVTSNRPDELLGEWLVTRGVIDRAELDMALAMMPRFEGRLGETLVALGLVDPVNLFHHISEQVQDKLLEVFEWRDGHAAFYRGTERPERAFPLGLDPWALLEAGAARRIAAGLERSSFAGHEADLLEQTELDVEPLGLPTRWMELWTACGAPRSLGELDGFDTSAASAVRVMLELRALRWKSAGHPA